MYCKTCQYYAGGICTNAFGEYCGLHMHERDWCNKHKERGPLIVCKYYKPDGSCEVLNDIYCKKDGKCNFYKRKGD